MLGVCIIYIYVYIYINRERECYFCWVCHLSGWLQCPVGCAAKILRCFLLIPRSTKSPTHSSTQRDHGRPCSIRRSSSSAKPTILSACECERELMHLGDMVRCQVTKRNIPELSEMVWWISSLWKVQLEQNTRSNGIDSLTSFVALSEPFSKVTWIMASLMEYTSWVDQ